MQSVVSGGQSSLRHGKAPMVPKPLSSLLSDSAKKQLGIRESTALALPNHHDGGHALERIPHGGQNPGLNVHQLLSTPAMQTVLRSLAQKTAEMVKQDFDPQIQVMQANVATLGQKMGEVQPQIDALASKAAASESVHLNLLQSLQHGQQIMMEAIENMRKQHTPTGTTPPPPPPPPSEGMQAPPPPGPPPSAHGAAAGATGGKGAKKRKASKISDPDEEIAALKIPLVPGENFPGESLVSKKSRARYNNQVTKKSITPEEAVLKLKASAVRAFKNPKKSAAPAAGAGAQTATCNSDDESSSEDEGNGPTGGTAPIHPNQAASAGQNHWQTNAHQYQYDPAWASHNGYYQGGAAGYNAQGAYYQGGAAGYNAQGAYYQGAGAGFDWAGGNTQGAAAGAGFNWPAGNAQGAGAGPAPQGAGTAGFNWPVGNAQGAGAGPAPQGGAFQGAGFNWQAGNAQGAEAGPAAEAGAPQGAGGPERTTFGNLSAKDMEFVLNASTGNSV
jgi:hypothetical protein